MTKNLFLVSFFCFSLSLFSQSIEIKGKVESKVSIENINIINSTSRSYSVTNINGEFAITAKLNDTLQFLSILHKPKSIIIDENMILTKIIKVYLEEQINELNEVTVGNALTGNLLLDIKSMEGKTPINFYDVGIPGYTGKIATQSERRLSEASEFRPTAGGSLGGAGMSVSATAIINAISGRTKMLKKRVDVERREDLIQTIKGRLSKDFFASNPLDEDLRMDFFYFCSDDENFIKYCKNETDFNILIFLRMKYKQYLKNMSEGKD